MDELKKWIYTIVVIIVFVTFIEMLMPNSSMKKYSKLILGVLVMTIILQPLFSLVNKNFSLSADSLKFENQLNSSYIKEQSTSYSEKQNIEITKQYKQNIEKQIGQYVKKEIGEKDIEVTVQIIEDMESEDYGEIKKIYLNIKGGINKVKTVDKVIIGDSEEPGTKINNDNYLEIKNKISTMYDIDKGNIEIKTEN